MIALLYNLQIRILISGTSSGWGGITKFRQIFSDFDCECTQAVNFVPFFFQVLMYTMGRPPTIKAQEDEDFFCSTLYIVATAAVVGQISHNCEQLLAIHRVEYHCVNNLVRHKSSPSKGRLVRRSVFLQKDKKLESLPKKLQREARRHIMWSPIKAMDVCY